MNDSFTNTRYTPEAKTYELATRERSEMNLCTICGCTLDGKCICWEHKHEERSDMNANPDAYKRLKESGRERETERSEMTHTPGPWTVGSSFGHVFGPDDIEVCMVKDNRRTGPEFDANARLIAAAPALLEALEALVDDFDASVITTDPMLVSARAVIALAKGEEVTT